MLTSDQPPTWFTSPTLPNIGKFADQVQFKDAIVRFFIDLSGLGGFLADKSGEVVKWLNQAKGEADRPRTWVFQEVAKWSSESHALT